MPLTEENLLFCKRTRDSINSDPNRRAFIAMDIYADMVYVCDQSRPILEKNTFPGKKRIVGWRLPDGGSGET